MNNLDLVQTEHNTFLVVVNSNEHLPKGYIVGKYLRINPVRNKTGIEYSTYVSENEVQVCSQESVIFRRKANELETQIYNEAQDSKSLTKEEKGYLKNNFFNK